MKKFQQLLYNSAENGNDEAAELYLKSMDLNDDELALWVANNDKKIREAIALNDYASMLQYDEDGEIKEWLKEYNDLRQKGLLMFTGDKRLGPTGQPLKTLDDFMTAFGVDPEPDGNDDERAAFTNPENPKYWGNMSEEDKTLAAVSLGYDSSDDMKRDLDRAANQFQRVLKVEGWGPNNEGKPIHWIGSALLGLGAPRVKEAQLAGREPTWQDITGDVAEFGLNFVPGVGLVKAGKVIAKLPKVGNIANNKAMKMAGRGVALVGDQAAVPVGTQLLDSKFLYNPNVFGENTSVVNPRSEFDLTTIGLQTGAIAGAKGALRGFGGIGQSIFEQGMGNESGGEVSEKIFKAMERVGEKTDDLIARRQLMLDRKAELAKKRAIVTLKGDVDISANMGTVDDLINAENFRILTSEAERIANSKKARKLYDVVKSGDEAARELTMREYGTILPITPEDYSPLKKRLSEGLAAQKKVKTTPEVEYRYANEQSPYKSLLMTTDGRVVPRDYVTIDGELRYPETDYTFKLDEKLTPLDYKYDDYYNSLKDHFRNNAPIRVMPAPNDAIDASNVVSRNPAVLEQIEKDELLKRKLNPNTTFKREMLRDAAANVAFNALAREGLVGGDITQLNKAREDAIWNRTMNKLRPLTANPELSPEARKKNIDAILNVMQYSLDGVPHEIYAKNPKIYHTIADNLGIKEWYHPSVRGE